MRQLLMYDHMFFLFKTHLNKNIAFSPLCQDHYNADFNFLLEYQFSFEQARWGWVKLPQQLKINLNDNFSASSPQFIKL